MYHIEELSDEDKQIALQNRADEFGIRLPDEVAKYWLAHTARDSHSIFKQLRELDQANLIHQRKLTVPFVKEILNLD